MLLEGRGAVQRVTVDVLAEYGMDVLAAGQRLLVVAWVAGRASDPGVLLLDAWADERIDRVEYALDAARPQLSPVGDRRQPRRAPLGDAAGQRSALCLEAASLASGADLTQAAGVRDPQRRFP